MNLSTNDDIHAFIQLCQFIGNQNAYVQGAGGNMSIKFSPEKMFIKASGIELRNISDVSSLVQVNYQQIRTEFCHLPKTEFNYNQLIQKYTDNTSNNLKPSIETGMHTFLPHKVILHTHSIYANVLTCATQGKIIMEEIFPQALWLDYYNPGVQLAEAFLPHSQTSASIIFLKNHGVIVAGSSSEEVFALHKEVNHTLIEFLKLPLFNPQTPIIYKSLQYLFPDHLMYCKNMLSKHNDIIALILTSVSYILEQQQRLSLETNFLADNDVEIILNMDSEKHRMNLSL
jgi:rhamnose utilization protein RhaD (predicted bifunctional aldolase and dehydrogenase)